MTSHLNFSVEEIYSGYERKGQVLLSDEEMDRLLLCLRASDWETSLYTSDLETVCPDIFRKIDEASIPLMDEMDAEMAAHGGTGEIDNEYPFGHYRVELELPETTSGNH